ncbi:MAG: hypothetical protein JJ896_11205 [Rhodothermales bacterium]|nr:hypothetical protein [Rhodothermales bacterium]MBO6780209.1 hypothetical protein [Rhodothermales bacterium]
MKHVCSLFAVVVLAAAVPASAQYTDNRALQKAFENVDFFFKPAFVNPYGLEGFGTGVPGLLNDPLLNLHLTPSLAQQDSSSYAYVDFRSTREAARHDYYYPLYGVNYDAALSSFVGYWPRYHIQTYRPAEPVMSLAFITNPAPNRTPDLTVGITYQLATDAQAYYDVPNNLYRGLDMANAAVDEGYPVTQVAGGSDQMRTTGHFPSAFAALQLSDTWRVGARIASASFDRNGEVGNFHNPGPATVQEINFSSQWDSRNQEYDHLDFSVGAHGQVSERVVVGGSLGYLSGKGTQWQDGASRFHYLRGLPASEEFSLHSSGSLNESLIQREGGATRGNLFLRKQIDENRLLSVSWTGRWQSLDLSGRVLVDDSTQSENYSNRPNTSYRYDHRYASSNFDERLGTGTGDGNEQRLHVGLDWQVSSKARLLIGAAGARSVESLDTREDVTSRWSMAWSNFWTDGDYVESNAMDQELIEDKEVRWEYRARRSSLQIPVLLWHDLSSHFQLVAGVTRTHQDVEIDDETIAMIHRREVTENGVTRVTSRFGESFREPSSFRTVIETGAILGITARPSSQVDVRLLISPRWSDQYDTRRTDWWLGIQLRP